MKALHCQVCFKSVQTSNEKAALPKKNLIYYLTVDIHVFPLRSQHMRFCYLLLDTTRKFGSLFLFNSPIPPSRKPVHVSCNMNMKTEFK